MSEQPIVYGVFIVLLWQIPSSFKLSYMSVFQTLVSLSVWESGWMQKEKNKYHISMHVYEISKNGADEPVYRAGIKMQM